MARLAGSLWSVPTPQQRERLATAVAGGLGHVHWDATDGVFAVAGGFSPDTAAGLADGLAVGSEAHLMMRDPGPELVAWAELCDLVVVPVEIADWSVALRRIEAAGAVGALAVSPGTDLAVVPRGGFPVLVMSVQPGDAGAEFRPGTLDRVRALAGRGCHPMVGADGGVRGSQLPGLREAGATWAVSGTSLFNAPDLPGWLGEARATFG
ncbi:MAG: hypothetical protein AAGC63_01255 [Propionicimonas sp.]|nr:hypothetical protein [Propionicimonas sp.]